VKLPTGARLGPYIVSGPLGAGGMGEVYRARDTRLERDVAIKILPERVAADPAARARFEREARAVASLSHPNILAIHDVGIEAGTPYSVTELLEGSTLRDRLAGEGAPVRKALDWALQISQGLAAAHDRGIVHRDLKPENVFITADGRAKILDFGLAKSSETADGGPLTQAPTLGPGTEPGTVLGTVGYMSPEQVRGKPLDARSDLFSFGAILYELMSGRRAFAADTAADTMTAILREDPPDFASERRDIPPALERIVRHCLEKDAADRFQSTRDLVFSLQAVTGLASSRAVARAEAPVSRGTRLLPAFAIGLLAGALVSGAVVSYLARGTAPAPLVLKTISYSGLDRGPSGSRDGRFIAFTSERDGRKRIWLKQYPGGDEVALTSGPDSNPRFSPDGAQVLFDRDEANGRSALYRVAAVGGEPRKLVEDATEADWSPDGRRIVFLRDVREENAIHSAVHLVDANGEGERAIFADAPRVQLSMPRWSPDGSTIAILRRVGENSAGTLLLLDAAGGKHRDLLQPAPAGLMSAVTWSPDSRSVFYSQAAGIAASGDIAQSSTARLVRQDVRSGRDETLLWLPGHASYVDQLGEGRLLLGATATRANLAEAEVGGTTSPRWLTRGNSIDRQPVVSPDGRWVLFSSTRGGGLDLWKLSLETGAAKRITEDPADDWDPAFTRDGAGILWSSSRSGVFEIWMCDADGLGARQVTHDGVDAENPAATPDKAWIVYNSGNPAHSGIWRIHPDGSGAMRLVPGTWSTPELSPDGRFIVFRAGAEPRSVHVARFEDGALLDIPIEVSTESLSARPRWLPDGRSFAFTGLDAMGVRGVFVQPFVPGTDTRASRRPLAGFDPGAPVESFGIAPDGKHVILSKNDRIQSLMLVEGVSGLSGRQGPSP
jgi:serine/threonine protein kinase/Tol biopolymer transport system component